MRLVVIDGPGRIEAKTYQNEGGGIYMEGSASATLKNCTIRNCRAYDYGGAICMEDEGNRLSCENVNIISCTVNDNNGGAVYQDYGETNWIGGSIVNCRAYDHGGGIYAYNGKVNVQNVRFENNHTDGYGGAFYSDSRDGAWFTGCEFLRNHAEQVGGAIYADNDNIYMKDCSVVSNSSVSEGGGIYLASTCTLGVAGKTVIRSNDGTGSMDNLVLDSNAFIYDHGLDPGSEIRLRSYYNGSVKLGGSLMSDYQLGQYFRSDYGRLELTETQTVNTELRASVFSEGTTALIVGGALLIAAAAFGVISYRRKRKGGSR